MDADSIFNESMAAFKQEQLDGGMSPESYGDALLEALIHKAEQLTNKGVKFNNYWRGNPESAAQDLQSIISANDEPDDDDGTIDLDDDGGDE